ncbi:hypothetical protein HDF16_006284 [Granulicella aggregans]|uniref:Uncharacterized protein n=1 Tax=Granulicella aggregans TaxID=474949 RepID=A0A7W8E6U1_9BACT|nr:hypothetical protein [Granulicella aggregans]MBB5061548.1 hypothetical protein [Granulicella aggregans]
MKPVIMIAARVLPLSLILLGLASAFVAALSAISPQKGMWRLAASFLVGAAFTVGSITQMLKENQLWPGVVGLGAGAFLMWIGYRKYKKEFKALLEEFYSDSPHRLKASLFGLTLVVKKPSSDQEQD